MRKTKSKASQSKAPKKTAKKATSDSQGTKLKGAGFDLDVVQNISDFMRENELVELDVKLPKVQIRLRRFEEMGGSSVGPSKPSKRPLTPESSAKQASAPEPGAEAQGKIHQVKSPFVGTFYRAPGPNQDSFVEEGKIVSPGDTLCIVEAMKLMNEIEAEVKGRIKRVLVSNETPVEFGEALFEIEVF